MKVYLDDIRPAPNGWIRTYSVAETIELLKTSNVTHLSLDHDLGIESEVGTGYDVLLWIEKQVFTTNFNSPDIVIHSDNPAAVTRMKLAVKRIGQIASRRR
jgi:hypothetical protein